MKTICYFRVSSPMTKGRSRQTTDSQKLALKNYCRHHGIKRPTFIEDHSTGRNQERKGLQETLSACRQGKCQSLIILKLDRLGRSMIETVQTIRELLTLNVKIVVTTQGLTFDQSPYSTFLIQLFACLPELESSRASERIRAGLQVARAKGKELGRPIDVKKRAKLLRWDKAKLSVKDQAKRLGVSPVSVYAMRKRMKLAS